MGSVSLDNKYSEYDIDNGAEDQTLSVFPYQESAENKSWACTLPVKQGLYDPSLEKDACGVGFAA
jgi:glutamate synthase (NADH)